jgi:hypothetical protein
MNASGALVDRRDMLGAFDKFWGSYARDPQVLARLDACIAAFRAGRPFGFDDSLRLIPIQITGMPFGASLACASNPGRPTLHFLIEFRDVRMRWAPDATPSTGQA